MTVPEKRSRQATETRQMHLVDAALQLAAQRSPADITTGDLARAVGITQGAVFRHFASKEAIWLAVLDWTADTLIAALEHAVTGAPDPLAALQAVFKAHVDFVMAHPGVPRVIFQELQHAQDTALKARVRGLMQQYRTLVMDLLQRAQALHLLAPAIDLPAAAVLFLGSVQGLVLQSLASGQVQAMGVQAPGVFSIFLRGIAVRHPNERTP
jgi:AcrR family transcriptional regulator